MLLLPGAQYVRVYFYISLSELEMCGKAQRDSAILVLLTPPGEYN